MKLRKPSKRLILNRPVLLSGEVGRTILRKFTIFIVFFLITTILGGCITDSDMINKYDIYSGIEKKDISDLTDPTKIDFVYIYQGSSDNWAATYYTYRFKGEEYYVERFFMKYIGEEPTPTGQLSYSYKTAGSTSRGDLPANSNAKSNSRVYNLGQGGGNGLVPGEDAIVSFMVKWNGKSESFELKSAKKSVFH